MKLRHIQPQFIPIIADELIPFFKRNEERSLDQSITVHGIFRMLYSGEWTLWVIQDDENYLKGVACTHPSYDMMNRIVMNIAILSGDGWDEWGMDTLAEFEKEAAKNGVYSIEWEGREGWIAKVPGYTKVRTVMRKVLNHGLGDNHSN